MVMLIPCTAAATRSPHGLRNFECPRGTAGVTKNVSKSVWAMMIALGLLMAVLYVVHAGMAWFVRRYLKRKQGGDEIPLEVDPAAAQKARDRWTKLTREGYL